MRNKFRNVIEALVETDTLPSQDVLGELSNLDQSEVRHLSENWDQISKKLRRSLLEELGKQANENILLSFEQINRLGIDDKDDEVRRLSILNLWESEDPVLAISLVDKLTDDPSEDVRAAAASILGGYVLIGETQELPHGRLELIENALLEAHQNSINNLVHRNSLESLGYSSRKEVSDLILSAFKSDEETLIRSALVAMGRSANKKWKDFVLTHLQSPSPDLRLQSVVAVGELEIQEALGEIIELIEDADNKIRHASIWSLSQLGGTRAADILAELFNATDENEELQHLENALDNLAFVNGTRDMLLFDFDDNEELFS